MRPPVLGIWHEIVVAEIGRFPDKKSGSGFPLYPRFQRGMPLQSLTRATLPGINSLYLAKFPLIILTENILVGPAIVI